MMRKLLVLVFLINSIQSFSQFNVVQRSTGSNTVQDVRVDIKSNLFIPKYFDTVAANIARGIDSSGAIIKTYMPDAMWVRGSNPKRWMNLLPTGSLGTLATVATTGDYNDLNNKPAPTTGASSVSTTLAQLRAATTTTNNIYYTNDLGGGMWVDKGLNDGVHTDDGIKGIVSNNGHWVERVNLDKINVKWFGAIGNGVTNDSIALRKTFDYAATNDIRHVYIPTGRYIGSYTKPLIIKGDGIIVEGDGSGTNENITKASIIYGLVQIGDIANDAQTTRGQFRDFSIFGPGTSDVLNFNLHTGTGLTIVKAMESRFNNVSIEGFKYGVDVYNTPDAAILYAYSITFDHCRFYGNKVANFVWGRVGHQLNLLHSNISYSDYNIVFGVFDKTADTLIFGNAEPNLTLNVQGNAIQAARKISIVVTNGKKVTIRDNYFEEGNVYQGATAQIQLGSFVPTSTYVGNGGGFEDNVPVPVVEGNWFFQQTGIYTYPVNYANIKVVNVNGGSITNNLLNNIPYPNLVNDTQLSNTYLIRNDSAKLAKDVFYTGNKAAYAREITKQYKVKDGGFNSFHNTYTFEFVSEKPPYMKDVNNVIYYKGVRYNLSWLGGGTDPNSVGAKFGMTVSDITKLPQITSDELYVTDGFLPIVSTNFLIPSDTTGRWQSILNNNVNTNGSPSFVNVTTNSNSNLGGYNVGKSVNGVWADYTSNTGAKFPKFGAYGINGSFSGLGLTMSNNVLDQMHVGFEGASLKGINIFPNGLINYDTTFKQPDVDTTSKIQVLDQFNSGKYVTPSKFKSDLSLISGNDLTPTFINPITTVPGTSPNHTVTVSQLNAAIASVNTASASQFKIAIPAGVGIPVISISPTDSTVTAKRFILEGPNVNTVTNNDSLIRYKLAPRIATNTTTAVITPDFQFDDGVKVLALASDVSVANPIGTGTGFQRIIFRIRDNGTARAISWGTKYRPIGVTLPTTTVAGKLLYVEAIFNADDNTGMLDIVRVNQEL